MMALQRSTTERTDLQIHHSSTDDYLIIATLNGTLLAFDRHSGDFHWQTTGLGDALIHGITYTSNSSEQKSVFVIEPTDRGAIFENIYKDDNLYTTRLPFTVQDIVQQSPLRSSDGRLFLGAMNTLVATLDLHTGQPISNNINDGADIIVLARRSYTVHGFESPSKVPIGESINHPIMDVTYSQFHGLTDISHQHPEPVQQQQTVMFSTSGAVVVIDTQTQRVLWARKLDAIPVGAFVLFRGQQTSPSTSKSNHVTANQFTILPLSVQFGLDQRLSIMRMSSKLLFALSSEHYIHMDQLHSETSEDESSDSAFLPSAEDTTTPTAISPFQICSQYPSCLEHMVLDYDAPLSMFQTPNLLPSQSSQQQQQQFPVDPFPTSKPWHVAILLVFISILLYRLRRIRQHFQRQDPLVVFHDQVLGTGSNGTVVFKGTYLNRPVAIKRMLNEFIRFSKNEINILQKTDHHPNIIRMFYSRTDKEFTYIALELCRHSLINYWLDSTIDNTIDPLDIMKQTTIGLEHLHSNNIIHRDLKPQNILITNRNNNNIVISDFGFCKHISTVSNTSNVTIAPFGSLGWRAPEVLANTALNAFSKESDIYALGLVFFYIWTKGQHPFMDLENPTIDNYPANAQATYSKLLVIKDPLLRELLSNMLHPDPSCRPSATQVLLDPFFWSIQKRMSFLLDVSDIFEAGDQELLDRFEDRRFRIFNNNTVWNRSIDHIVWKDITKYRWYDPRSPRDLLRALRNKRNHFQEQPDEVRQILGNTPENLFEYFNLRFPNLLIETHLLIRNSTYCSIPPLDSYYRH